MRQHITVSLAIAAMLWAASATAEQVAKTSEATVPSGLQYLVGYSRGGFGAWSMAEQFPETFAAIVPIAGGGIRHYLNRTNANAAFWVFHGEADETIPLSDSVVMFQRLKELERDARLTVLEGVDHAGVEAAVLGDPQLFDWLLQQKLEGGEPEAQ